MKSSTLGLAAFLATIFSAQTFASDGHAAYERYCKMCHASGSAGAPIVGKKTDWEERLKKDASELENNAVNGFRGNRGYMPPKGGFPKISEDDVKAAVAYMIKTSQ
jgi:cytochrome c5